MRGDSTSSCDGSSQRPVPSTFLVTITVAVLGVLSPARRGRTTLEACFDVRVVNSSSSVCWLRRPIPFMGRSRSLVANMQRSRRQLVFWCSLRLARLPFLALPGRPTFLSAGSGGAPPEKVPFHERLQGTRGCAQQTHVLLFHEEHPRAGRDVPRFTDGIECSDASHPHRLVVRCSSGLHVSALASNADRAATRSSSCSSRPPGTLRTICDGVWDDSYEQARSARVGTFF